MSINLSCNPVVKNINTRAVGHDDDRLIYADIKFEASVDPAELNQFLVNASQHFWEKTMGKEEHLIARFPTLGDISVKGKWEGVAMKLAPDDSFFDASTRPLQGAVDEFDSGYLQKVKFTALQDSCYLSFEFSTQIPGMKIGQLIDRILNQQVAVQIYSTQGELDV